MTSRDDFEWTAGAICLDFVDTLAQRTGEARDLLDSPERLADWFRLAGLQADPIAPANARVLGDARRLRNAIHRAVDVVIAGHEPEPADLSRINRHARAAPPRPQLVRGRVTWTAGSGTEAALSAVAADAVLLLAVDRRARLRTCPSCAMQFFDNSRPGKRKWCSSQSGCGNRDKVRRYRAVRLEGK